MFYWLSSLLQEIFLLMQVVAICREAALSAMQEDINACQVTMEDFQSAFELVKPQTTHEMIKSYQVFAENSGLSPAGKAII